MIGQHDLEQRSSDSANSTTRVRLLSWKWLSPRSIAHLILTPEHCLWYTHPA